MKINGNAIRPGMVIQHQGRLWRAIKIQHTQPGKGGAYLQVELRDIQRGTKLNERFRASETVERARLEQKEYQYLYTDGVIYTFMDNETYEQISIDSSLIDEESIPFLQENMTVSIESFEGEIIGIQLPDSVILEVVEAEPVVKGQTASSSFKPALLENGVKIQVPTYVEVGMRVVVNTAEQIFVERAKN